MFPTFFLSETRVEATHLEKLEKPGSSNKGNWKNSVKTWSGHLTKNLSWEFSPAGSLDRRGFGCDNGNWIWKTKSVENWMLFEGVISFLDIEVDNLYVVPKYVDTI
jgi:hypothetical protein